MMHLKDLTQLFCLVLVITGFFHFHQSASAADIQLSVSPLQDSLPTTQMKQFGLEISVVASQIERDRDRIPLNIAFVLDASSAIQYEDLQLVFREVFAAITLLKGIDSVAVIAGHESTELVLPATYVNNSEQIKSSMGKPYRGGRMRLFAALSKGSRELAKYADQKHLNQIILLASKPESGVLQSKDDLACLAQSFRRDGVAITVIELGSVTTSPLLASIADYSSGRYYLAAKFSKLQDILTSEFDLLFTTLFPLVELEVKLPFGVELITPSNQLIAQNGQVLFFNLGAIRKQQVIKIELPLASLAPSSEDKQVLLKAQAVLPDQGSSPWAQTEIMLSFNNSPESTKHNLALKEKSKIVHTFQRIDCRR